VEALAVAFDLGILHLICDRAHPPGRPLAFIVSLADSNLSLTGKSAGSKRRVDDRFDVRVRLSSLRREQRAKLESAFEPQVP
jgi:hypothetical protein